MTIDQSTPDATLNTYTECCRTGNVAGLKQIFHEQASMYGFLAGQMMAGSPEPFYEAVGTAPCPESSGEPYQAEIVYSLQEGDTATLVLREDNYLGMRFTNSFQLIRTDGSWFIVSKLFQSAAA